MASHTTFGDLLRQLRKRAGMTQGDLAAAVGYSVSFVCDLEQNRRLPSVMVVFQKFVPALGLQEEVAVASHLVELAALARGERPPATMMVQQSGQLVITETFTIQPSRLPAQPTELIGREHEVKTLCQRVQGHSGRLLTLVGPPGVGKTRLGLEVASRLEPLFKDGARFIALAAVSDPELVGDIIATELKLMDTGNQTTQARLIQGLRQKEMLLLLDNFEQIIAAAPLLAILLGECPGLYVLVTSRERLHLRAEQRFPVPPLDLTFAVTLFAQRVRDLDPTFESTELQPSIIPEICRRLDCLPLAIELVAAHIIIFSPQNMLMRLQDQGLDLLADGAQDIPESQRTLRNAIHRSYVLCTLEEQHLFRLLGVFAGGFDLAVVVHLGFAEAELQTLVHKNLLKVEGYATGEPRFLLLETLRAYALEQLVQTNEIDAARRTHALYFFNLAKHTNVVLSENDWNTKSLHAMEREVDNLRIALPWIVAHQPALGVSFFNHMYSLWHSGHYRYELYRWIETAYPRIQPESTLDYASFLEVLATIRFYHYGDLVSAQAYAEASLALFRQLQHPFRHVDILKLLAHIHQTCDDCATARALIEEGVVIARTEGKPSALAFALLRLREILLDLGDQATARTLLHEMVALWRSLADPGWQAQALRLLAYDTLQQGELGLARIHCEGALQLYRSINDVWTIGEVLPLLARITWHQGDKKRTTAVLDELLTLARTGDQTLLRIALRLGGLVAQENGDRLQAQALLTECLVLVQANDRLESTRNQAIVAYLISGWAGLLEPSAPAALLLSVASRLLKSTSSHRDFVFEQAHHERILAEAHAQLDEATFNDAYTAGLVMTPNQAIAFALAQSPA